jgi:hypothetical protein
MRHNVGVGIATNVIASNQKTNRVGQVNNFAFKIGGDDSDISQI